MRLIDCLVYATIREREMLPGLLVEDNLALEMEIGEIGVRGAYALLVHKVFIEEVLEVWLPRMSVAPPELLEEEFYETVSALLNRLRERPAWLTARADRMRDALVLVLASMAARVSFDLDDLGAGDADYAPVEVLQDVCLLAEAAFNPGGRIYSADLYDDSIHSCLAGFMAKAREVLSYCRPACLGKQDKTQDGQKRRDESGKE